MANQLKTRIFSLVLTFVMFASFNLSFYPAPVYAQDEEQTYIYKPSEEFNEAKTKTETWTPSTVNKVLLGLMAVAALTAGIFNPNKTGAVDCPTNFVGKTGFTLRAVQAGALAYLGGEIQANARYKKAAEKAANLNFDGTNTDDTVEGNKQVQAFNSLIDIYDEQVGAANTKMALSIVGQAGYTAAAGVEISNMLACKATCQSSHKSVLTIVSSAKMRAAGCPGSLAGLASLSSLEAGAASTSALVKGETKTTTTKKIFNFKNFISNVPVVGAITSAIGKQIKNLRREVQGGKNEAVNTSATVAAKAVGAGALASLAGPQAIALASVCGIAEEAALELVTAAATPVYCCGTDSQIRPTYYMDPSGIDTWAVNYDIDFQPGGSTEAIVNIENQNAIDEMTTLIAYNALYEEASEKILNSDLSKEKKIREIANLSNQLDKTFEYLTKNMNGFSLPFHQKKLGNELAHTLLKGDFKKLPLLLKELSRNIIIPTAYANPWMESLGWAGAILVLRGVLKQQYKDTAAPTPQGRAIYFSLLAGVGGYVLSQDIKTLKELKKRRDVIKIEKEKFEKAGKTDSSISQGSDDSVLNLQMANYKLGTKGLGNYNGCIAPTGDSYKPVTCPSTISRTAVKLPELSKDLKKQLGTPYISSLNAMESAAYNASSGGYLDNPNLLGADLATANRNLNAMKIKNEEMRKKLDEMEKNSPQIKDKNGNVAQPLSLAAIHKEIMDSFGAGANLPQAAELAAVDEKAEEKKEEASVAALAAYEPVPVAPSTGFNLDLGMDDNGFDMGSDQAGAVQNLDDYVLDQNDISDKKEVSIFRILSNRYLLSYPKILEENKK